MRTVILWGAGIFLLISCEAPGDHDPYGSVDWDFPKSDKDTVAAVDKDASSSDTASGDLDAVTPDGDELLPDEDELTDTVDTDGDTPAADGVDGVQSDTDFVFSDSYAIQWGTSQYDTGRGIAVESDGQFYVTGDTYGIMSDEPSPGGLGDVFLTRHDGNGKILWTLQWGTDEIDTGYDVATDMSGTIYVTGETNGDISDEETGNSGQDGFLTKVSSSGQIVWTEQWGEHAGDERGTAVAVDGLSGDIIVVGYTDYYEEGFGLERDVYLLRYGDDGAPLKTVRWGTDARDEAAAVAIAADGSVYVVGMTEGDLEGQTLKGSTDIFVTKLDAAGDRLWTRLVGTDDSEAYGSVAVAQDGSVYVAGATYGDFEGNDIGDLNAFLAKLTPAGDLSWVKRWGGPSSEENTQVVVNEDGDIFVVGETFGDIEGRINKGADDIFVTQWHPDGTKGTTLLVGTDVNEHVFGVSIGADDAIFATGETFGDLGTENAGGFDVYVVKFLKDDF